MLHTGNPSSKVGECIFVLRTTLAVPYVDVYFILQATTCGASHGVHTKQYVYRQRRLSAQDCVYNRSIIDTKTKQTSYAYVHTRGFRSQPSYAYVHTRGLRSHIYKRLYVYAFISYKYTHTSCTLRSDPSYCFWPSSSHGHSSYPLFVFFVIFFMMARA